MFDPYELFRSCEWIWAVWFCSTTVLLVAVVRGRRRFRGLGRRLLRDQRGAAYTLSYVLTFPFYLLLIALAIESSLLLVTKIGTIYAAYAAARSAAVWESALPAGRMPEKAKQAAAQAMTPFASGASQHQAGAPGGSVPNAAKMATYLAAYRTFSDDGEFSADYLRRKYQYAWRATRVSLATPAPGGDWNVTATIDYQAPLHIPGIARLLGQRAPGGSYHVLAIQTRATLPSETPRNDRRTIGIEYRSE